MGNIYREHTQNRSVGWSTWHLQWCTKYRYKVFHKSTYKNLCKVLIYETSEQHAFEIFDYEIDIDHVHIIVSLPLTMTPLYAIQLMKGRTAKGMFLAYPHLQRLYRKGHLWSPGKFVGSVGHITLDKAKEYLKAHHAKSLVRNPCSEAEGGGVARRASL